MRGAHISAAQHSRASSKHISQTLEFIMSSRNQGYINRAEDVEHKEDEDVQVEEEEEVEVMPITQNSFIMNPPFRRYDPGPFLIPISIQKYQFLDCLIDSGSTHNLLPKHIFKTLQKSTKKQFEQGMARFIHQRERFREINNSLGSIVIQIWVGGNPLEAEFVIIDDAPNLQPRQKIILGRPFLATTKAILNFDESKITLKFPNVTLEYGCNGWLNKREVHNLFSREQIAAERAWRCKGGDWKEWN